MSAIFHEVDVFAAGSPASCPAPPQTVIVGSGIRISLDDVIRVARLHHTVELSTISMERMAASRAILEDRLRAGESIYGVTTGFGGNSHYHIPQVSTDALQHNLLRFLRAGSGAAMSTEVVRASMLLRAHALAQGWSCVRPEVVEQLIYFLNCGITPHVPEYGSVGASGDLVPSAYIGSCLCGDGKVEFQGRLRPAAEALDACGLTPLDVRAKEGLALCNGTTAMTALAAFAVYQAEAAFYAALNAIALAVEAMGSVPDYYDDRIQAVKGHPGQIAVAALLRELLQGSGLAVSLDRQRACSTEDARRATTSGSVIAHAQLAQAPYSLRCAPQGLGPVWESLGAARHAVEREANSVNDNPLIDPVTGDVLYTSNFYGGHIARFMDGLKIDIACVANWLHSVLALLMDSRFSRGLPDSLSPTPGVHQGLKGLQISHSSLVTYLRQQSSPSSVHTLPTEQFNQDVVSLGTHAALTANRMSDCLRDVVSMTLLAAAQAVDLRQAAGRLAPRTRLAYNAVRRVSTLVLDDRPLDGEIAAFSHLIERRKLGDVQ